MATTEPADVQMRIDLALDTVEEVTARIDQAVRQDGTVPMEEFAADVYGLLAHLAEAVGNLAMGLRLVKEA